MDSRAHHREMAHSILRFLRNSGIPLDCQMQMKLKVYMDTYIVTQFITIDQNFSREKVS